MALPPKRPLSSSTFGIITTSTLSYCRKPTYPLQKNPSLTTFSANGYASGLPNGECDPMVMLNGKPGIVLELLSSSEDIA